MVIHHHESSLPDLETQNRKIIKSLYKAIARGNIDTVSPILLASDHLEYFYHGPPNSQHMMCKLTGKSRNIEFKFRPHSITSFGDLVIVEGGDEVKAYWVHVWTLTHGTITQFREYFNTCLTLLLCESEVGNESLKLWQTDPQVCLSCSLPDLVLTI